MQNAINLFLFNALNQAEYMQGGLGKNKNTGLGMMSLGKQRCWVPWCDLHDSDISIIVVPTISVSMKCSAAKQKKLQDSCWPTLFIMTLVLIKLICIKYHHKRLSCGLSRICLQSPHIDKTTLLNILLVSLRIFTSLDCIEAQETVQENNIFINDVLFVKICQSQCLCSL